MARGPGQRTFDVENSKPSRPEATIFDNVLIGVDGRQGGRDAIALARQLAGPGAQMTLAHVYGAGLMPGRGAALLLASEAQLARRLLEQAREEAGIEAAIDACPDRSIGRGLQRRATSIGADLLVVGASSHRGFGRLFLGDDTQSALNGTPCPVAIATRDGATADRPLRRIGVGYDDSPESEEGLAIARALAARARGQVSLLGVVTLDALSADQPLPDTWPDLAVQRVDDRRRRLQSVLDEERTRVGDLGDVEVDAVYGDPGEELQTFSRGLDLLIVGSRSHGPLARLFNGSTSSYLARRCACPLLILPRSARAAGDAAAAAVASVP